MKQMLVVGAIALGGVFVALDGAHAGINGTVYGIACQESFDSQDLGPLHQACDEVLAFHNDMSSVGNLHFYYNLAGNFGPQILEDWLDSPTGVEATDIVYMTTHMGSNSSYGGFASSEIAGKKYPGVRAQSRLMRLGEAESFGDRGLSVLVLGGCATTAFYPRGGGDGVSAPYYPVNGYLDERWEPAFDGGLRIILGNWDFYDYSAAKGDKLAKFLRAGNTFWISWRSADWQSNQNNDTSVAASGNGSSDCWDRLSNMTLANMDSFPRRRDSQASYFCAWTWSNDSLSDEQ